LTVSLFLSYRERKEPVADEGDGDLSSNNTGTARLLLSPVVDSVKDVVGQEHNTQAILQEKNSAASGMAYAQLGYQTRTWRSGLQPREVF
jgi:hypothetical protein